MNSNSEKLPIDFMKEIREIIGGSPCRVITLSDIELEATKSLRGVGLKDKKSPICDYVNLVIDESLPSDTFLIKSNGKTTIHKVD